MLLHSPGIGQRHYRVQSLDCTLDAAQPSWLSFSGRRKRGNVFLLFPVELSNQLRPNDWKQGISPILHFAFPMYNYWDIIGTFGKIFLSTAFWSFWFKYWKLDHKINEFIAAEKLKSFHKLYATDVDEKEHINTLIPLLV